MGSGKGHGPGRVAPDVRLSLLDRSRTRADRPDAEGVTATVERAVRAERLGYQRFWVAEHHGVPGIASGTPAVLLAAVGATPSTIRLGSGGVMLPHHQPFVVAEQFRVLEALNPGRVDLGLGRSSGFTPPVRAVLREQDRSAEEAAERFADDVRELRAHLDGSGPVTVRPSGGPVPLFLLATGFYLIFTGLGTRRPGEPSAYSVFNGFNELPGTFNAARVDDAILRRN